MTRYYKATDSKGRVFTRSSGRYYAYAISGERAASWASRIDLAVAHATRWGGEINEAFEIDAKEYRAILKAKRA